MKNPNSVWTWPYRTRYYLLRPWEWVKTLFLNMRNARMRARKGFCYGDIWDFNTWFCGIAPEMLRYMADEGCAYPGSEPFDTAEKWHEWLYKMAERLEYCNKDFIDLQDEKNEYAKQMEEILDKAHQRWKENHPNEENIIGQEFIPEEEEIRKKFWEKEKEISKEQEAYIQETFTELGKHWISIWD